MKIGQYKRSSGVTFVVMRTKINENVSEIIQN